MRFFFNFANEKNINTKLQFMKQLINILLLFVVFAIITSCDNPSSEEDTNILHGQYIEKNNDGLIITIGHFTNGKRDGQFLYFDSKGKLQAQENYISDQLHDEQITIHSTGKINTKLMYEKGVKNGPYTKYYKTGKLQETGSYENDKKNGEVIWYYDNGQQNIIYTYENGQLNGPTKTFSKEGDLIEDGVYKNGIKKLN